MKKNKFYKSFLLVQCICMALLRHSARQQWMFLKIYIKQQDKYFLYANIPSLLFVRILMSLPYSLFKYNDSF